MRITISAIILGSFLLYVPLAEAQSSSSASSGSSSSAAAGPSSDALKNSILEDVNGDGLIELEAFGDSITRGVGDFIPVGDSPDEFPSIVGKEAGYPLRLEQTLALSVRNRGVPGEILNTEGLERFVRELPQQLPDIIFISGGANDANARASTNDYFYSLQTMVNFAQALGVKVVLVTTTPTCCEHENLVPYVDAYVTNMRAIGLINGLDLADANKAFSNTCAVGHCYLLNLEEGLHPNIEGYDVMTEAVLASIFRIDLFAADGAEKLESALNLTAGSIKTKPSLTAGS